MAIMHASSTFLGMHPTGQNAKEIVAAKNAAARTAAQERAKPSLSVFFPHDLRPSFVEEKKEQAVSSEFYRFKERGLEAPKEHVFVSAGAF